MGMKEKLSYKSKVHLFFGSGVLLVSGLSVAVNLFNGQTFLSAMLEALGTIRPVEYGMYLVFWYWSARSQQVNSVPAFTTLNLRDTKT